MSSRKMRPAFYALHAAVLDPDTTPTRLADALTAARAVEGRHRLSEGAVYASGCRRYLLDTGHHWSERAREAGDTTWTGSAHRYQERSRPDGSYDARCSCGAATVVFTADGPGPGWHENHTAGRVPGQLPTR